MRLTIRRSVAPRTQLVGVPLDPELSSTITPRRGRRPSLTRSAIG